MQSQVVKLLANCQVVGLVAGGWWQLLVAGGAAGGSWQQLSCGCGVAELSSPPPPLLRGPRLRAEGRRDTSNIQYQQK
jgi:hypothetical protein